MRRALTSQTPSAASSVSTTCAMGAARSALSTGSSRASRRQRRFKFLRAVFDVVLVFVVCVWGSVLRVLSVGSLAGDGVCKRAHALISLACVCAWAHSSAR
eukprot:3690343-Rhodomonas_salina.1